LLIQNAKPGKLLPPARAEMVEKYYVSDRISKILLGTKDYISVNSEGNKIYLQK
jgi:hypothetical protein